MTSAKKKPRRATVSKLRRKTMIPSSGERVNTMPKKIVHLPYYATELFRPHRYKILYGGRGGARSWTVARALLIKAAQTKMRVLCAREIQSSLRDSVHQLLRDQIDLMELPGYRVTDREMRHANGSLFLFEGLRHNVARIKSLEGVDVCWIEEAERISKASWNVVIPTIRKSGSEIWVTFNPHLEEDATYQRLVVHTPKDSFIRQVNWEDNYWLTTELRDEKDAAYELDAEAADHIWGGNLLKISDSQILRGKWSVQEFRVPHITRADGTREALWNGPYQGNDFGFGVDPFAAVRCWEFDNVLYVEYEVWQLKLELDHTPKTLMTTIPRFEQYTTRADNARPDSISYLRRHGIGRIVGAVKGPGSVEDGIAHLRSYKQIIIHPRCKHTIDECKYYSYKVDQNSGDILPVIVDKHNHIIDSLRYALEPLIQPRRQPGFIFTGGQKRTTCPRCGSYLPDDGVCPHCGEDAVAVAIAQAEARAREEAFAEALRPEVSETNGHTNGDGNGNGHTDTAVVSSPLLRLRGINKRS
jgi:phage terminase large subunit